MMPTDQVLHDDDESDIIAWPADQRGRTINYRMTPQRAGALADALEFLTEPEPRDHWRPEIDALRQAARQARQAGP